jgi:hypothetical protein
MCAAVLAAACGGRATVGSGTEPTVLEVVNRSTLDMNIYAVTDAGARDRLGTASSLQTTRFTIPQRLVAPALALRFQADPVGSTETHFSEQVPVVPGDTVVLEIPPE